MPITAGLVLTGVSAASKIISGISQKNAAKKLAASNVRPVFNVPDEFYQNKNLASSQATYGLSPESEAYYGKHADRGLSTGVDALLQTGAGPNTLSDLYDHYSDGYDNLANQDSQLKAQHINNLINANKDLAGEKTQAWALNYYEPYKDKALLASQTKASGDQNIQSGLTSAASALYSYGSSKLYNDDKTDRGETMGERLGNQPLEAASSPAPSIPGATISNNNPFATQGGLGYLQNLYSSNPNNPDVGTMLRALQNQYKTN